MQEHLSKVSVADHQAARKEVAPRDIERVTNPRDATQVWRTAAVAERDLAFIQRDDDWLGEPQGGTPLLALRSRDG